MKRIALLTAVTLIACYESSPYFSGVGPIPTGPWPEVCDGYWEGFESGEIDLQGSSVVFVPRRGTVATYGWSSDDGVRDFPFRPGNGDSSVTLSLGDDDSAGYRFQEMEELYFFGVRYTNMYVSSNGYVTFGDGSGSLSNHVSDHFGLPGVAALRGDLNPSSGGSVIVDEWPTRVVVTFEAVPGFGESTPNDFQIILHTNGVVEIHYLRITSDRSYLAGIGNGLDGPYPPETDFVGGSSTSEHCGDGRDNDGDGFIDCADVDCADDVRFCGPDRELDCWNGADDDGDGFWDCEDPDCAEECGFDWEWNCRDGLDNDGDGFVDCDDWDCEEECWEEWEFDCWDGFDNDGDGLIDCDDWDCEEECWADREFDCWDGIDNDRDGVVDCEDDDCWEECEGGWEWDCWDGFDNDRDGLIDCEDDDCWEECEGGWEWDCWDGEDNDRDGAVDCEDDDCWEECEGEREWDCWDGRDNDGDGFIDCDDWDCDDECWDRERDCWDGEDNDGDGLIDCDDIDCWEACGGDGERDCDNDWDDDHDGLIDCNDPDCFGARGACEVELNCGDGADNDADRRVDCDDADCFGSPDCGGCRGFWEAFDATDDLDFDHHSLRFLPDTDDPNGYRWTVVEGVESYPHPPGTGIMTTHLELRDDDFEEHYLEVMGGFPYFGNRYDSIFVSSNGFITFNHGSRSTSPTQAEHFAEPSIAGLRGDLDPRREGAVMIDEHRDRTVVTFDDVPWFGTSSPNSFQIVLYNSGLIEIHYPFLDADHRRTLIGISNGCGGVFPYPPETDFVTDVAERCDDGIDNDDDGYTDCDDWDCFGVEPVCTNERNCSDGHDNDRDGAIDCDDADCGGIPPCDAVARGYWESFDSEGEFDLEETAVFFVAEEGEPNGYVVFTEPGFPFYLEEPGDGEISMELRLSDDDFEEYDLRLMDGVEFYGERYRSIFVGSNGFVSFGEGSSSTSSAARTHFQLPAISGYRTDLDPRSGGRVVVDEWFDHVTVTFDSVPFFGEPGRVRNSFQIVIMEDGSLAIQYLEIGDRRGGTIGVSDGGGTPFPAETDFSSL